MIDVKVWVVVLWDEKSATGLKVVPKLYNHPDDVDDCWCGHENVHKVARVLELVVPLAAPPVKVTKEVSEYKPAEYYLEKYFRGASKRKV